MDKIERIIKEKLNKGAMKKTLKAAWICNLVNQSLDNGCEAISFSNGILKISAPDYSIASIIKFDQKKYLDLINNKIGFTAVKRISIVVRN